MVVNGTPANEAAAKRQQGLAERIREQVFRMEPIEGVPLKRFQARGLSSNPTASARTASSIRLWSMPAFA